MSRVAPAPPSPPCSPPSRHTDASVLGAPTTAESALAPEQPPPATPSAEAGGGSSSSNAINGGQGSFGGGSVSGATDEIVDVHEEINKSLSTISSYHDLVAALDISSMQSHDGPEERKKFQADCKLLRHRMRTNRRGLINPRSKFVQYWDMTTTMALLFTATVTPFEVCLGLETTMNAMLVINLVVNAIFMIDIGVQFFLPINDPQTGQLIRDHKRIAKHYLKSWFAIDIFTVLPFDLVTVAAPSLFSSDCGGGSGTLLKGVKLLRVLRLFKLIRVLRASRIIQRWDSSISISTSTRSMVTAMVAFCILLHWLACLWSLIPQLQPGLRDAEGLSAVVAARVAVDTTCEACLCGDDPLTTPACRSPCLTPCEIEELMALQHVNREYVYNAQSWLCRGASEGLLHPDFERKPFGTWVAALVVAMLQLLGGVAEIQPTNDVESVVFIISVLIGTVVFAGVQGVIIRVITTGNPDEMLFRQSLDALNYMMTDQRIPQEVRVRVRDYFRRAKGLAKRKSYVELIDSTLSTKMRGEMQYLLSCTVFQSVWWLRQCEAEFLQSLASCTEREAFAADERIPNVDDVGEFRMCILDQGLASRGGAILTSGASWGDLLISSKMLRDMRSAKALGYCEVVTLTRTRLDDALVQFPASQKLIREASLKLATQRAMIVISMYTRLRAYRAREARNRLRRQSEASGEAMPEVEVGELEPSEVLQAMRKANLMPGLAWREVEYVSTTDNKAGKKAVALADATADASDDDGADPLPGGGSAAAGGGGGGGGGGGAGAGGGLEDSAYAGPLIRSGGGGGGGGSSCQKRAQAMAAARSPMGKPGIAAAGMGARPAGRMSSSSRGGGGGAGNDRQVAALSKQQQASMAAIGRLGDEVKSVQASLSRIEDALAASHGRAGPASASSPSLSA
jgi:hypothetical protein